MVKLEPESLTATSDLDEQVSSGDQSEGHKVSLNAIVRGCLFVDAAVCGKGSRFLVDSGSAVTIISQEIYNSLPEGSRPELSSSGIVLYSASGDRLAVAGKANFRIKVGKLVYGQEAIVARLDQLSGILGVDFLCKHGGEIHFRDKTLKLEGQCVNLVTNGYKGCARIRVCETVSVPANSECHFRGYVDGVIDSTEGMVEPNTCVAKQGLLMAKVLVDPSRKEITLSVLNLGSQRVKLQQNTIVGELSPVGGVHVLEVEERDLNRPLPDHLKPMVDRFSPELSPSERNQATDLVVEYEDIFQSPSGEIGQTKIVEHRINTGDEHPIRIPARRISPSQKVVVEQELDKMLRDGIIQPSNSPWAAPVVLVTKKDGSVRFCIDYRKLNSITKKDAFPLPRIDDALDTLAGAKWFSTLDLASGYWQCRMNQEDKEKTAFSTHKGHFEWNVMPFGLCNAPATFSRLMQLVLGGLNWIKCLCYLDDVIIFGHTFEVALSNLREVFQCIREANLKLKQKKCDLFQTEVSYLGHVVSAAGITCDPKKVKAVRDWPVPENVSEVRSFLGLAGYYRRFIPNFSEVASPLTNLTRKNKRFSWDSACEISFETLKTLLTSAPILSYPTETGKFVLDTDASATGLGAVLSQIQEGEERVIAFASRTLNKSQTNYCTTHRELLAVVTFVKYFKHFLWGRPFLLRTDHASLTWLKNFKDPEGILARWLAVLDMYDMEIQHRPGSKHGNADSLSRYPQCPASRVDCPSCRPHNPVVTPVISPDFPGFPLDSLSKDSNQSVGVHPISQDTVGNSQGIPEIEKENTLTNWLQVWGPEQIKSWQHEDSTIGKFLALKAEHQSKPPKSVVSTFPVELRKLYHMWELLDLDEQGILCRKGIYDVTGKEIKQIVAPACIREEILHHLHNSRTSGHLGRDRTIDLVQKRFYWPGLVEDVKNWCRSCDACARRKSGPTRGRAPLNPSGPPGSPLERIAIDILGGLHTTENGNNYIIVVGDYFSKWAEAYAVPNHTAQTVADKLVTEFICRFGTPTSIHTDQGREFESDLFKAICEKLQIDKTRTTPYRPQSDGLVERLNRTLVQMLSAFVNENTNDWDDHLPYVMMAYRATRHSSTQCSPNLVMLNHEVSCPLDMMVGLPEKSKDRCPIEYVSWVQSAMKTAFEFVHGKLGEAATRQKMYYDQGSKERKFGEGDFVWRWYPPAVNNKLGQGWTGPYKVLARLTDINYKIQRSILSKPITVHIDHLKPYQGRETPHNWVGNDSDVESECDSGEPSLDDDIHLDDNIEPNSPRETTPRQTRVGRNVKPPCRFSP